MLLSPRPLPKRFNRRVSRQTKALLTKRHQRQRNYTFERWRRGLARVRRQTQTLKKPLMRALWIALIALIPLTIAMLFFSPILRLTSIGIARSDLRIDIPAVQRSLKPILGQRLFFISSHQVEDLVATAVPDLASATITKHYPNKVSVQLTLDPIVARMKIMNANDAQSSSAVAVDSGSVLGDYLTRGGIYVQYAPAQVPGAESLSELNIVDWSARPNVGTKPFDPRILERIPEAEHALSEQFDQTVLSRTIFVRAEEFHLQLKEFSLWFDLKSPLEEQLQRYRIFLQTVSPNDVDEYVDLRLADRIVYR